MTLPMGPVGDGGLQNERTSLAWGRTALSLVGVGALLARSAGSVVVAVAVLAAVGVVAGWLGLRAGHHHHDRHGRLAEGAPIPALPDVAATALATAALAATGLLLLLT